MKVKVNFQKKIITQNTSKEELVFQTNGILQNNVLSFIDNEQVVNVITLKFPVVIIERKGEIHSFLTFEQNKATTLLLKTNFGNLSIDIYTHKLTYENSKLEIIYDVIETNDENKTYELNIELK
ncbi:MAG: DUF1934 domain-containing protein [Bacilli bacterium]|nr:DUF1934 domain-containing protein [Bacilli bacterium]